MKIIKNIEEKVQISGFLSEKLPKLLFVVGIISMLISFFFYAIDKHHFFYSYLTAFTFFMTLTLGALFFVMILHITRAGWGVVVRRMAEHIMQNMGLMLFLFIPVLFGLHELYHWTHADAVAHDRLLQIKAPYLNIPFFYIRAFFYFVVWLFLANKFYKQSILQDRSGDSKITLGLQKAATYGILLYALSQSFAFIDWIMSLTPHWYSTIFGVYFFAGSILVALTIITLMLMLLRRYNFLKDIVTVEHYHDLGKLTYGFMIFWTYIAFSQFFLIWYANIPEETLFFKEHFHGSWTYITAFLCIGHFGVPFLGFMSRHVKRNLFTHALMAIWMVLMHYVDMYWIIMPNVLRDGFSYSLLDF
eukprot:SAG22_NODE_2460_length_2546_cov_1.366980_1_plen_359_part_10